MDVPAGYGSQDTLSSAGCEGKSVNCDMPALRVLCLFAFFLPGFHLRAAVSDGMVVEARLLTPIATYSSKSGTEIAALLTTAVCSAGERTLPDGVQIRGVIQRVGKVGLGLVHESASLRLDFRILSLPDGSVEPVEARLVSIDNARERVDKHGKVHGIRATAVLSSRAGQRLAFGAAGHPAAGLAVFFLEASVLRFPDPEIEYGRGTEIRLDVHFPDALGPVAACAPPDAETSPAALAEMQGIVDELPYWSYSTRQRQPMDLVNLVFTGEPEALKRAFAAAGWTGSRPNSFGAGLKAIRAITEGRAYADAPMRNLVLDGAEPDFRLQRSLNTFEKRDHLRIWRRDEDLGGQPVWASAATRDMDVTFGLHPFGFTHQIQNDVDLERDEVVRGLVSTGCVDSVTYVPRPETIRGTGERYRRGVSTDARVPVVRLNDCTPPYDEPIGAAGLRHPGKVVRLTRRVILTARNHFLRDNIVWRTGDALRLGYLTLRDWRGQRKEERLAREQDSRGIASP